MAGTENFDRAYQRLNPAQKQAVDAIDGPVMVIAGPGTGKTQTLTLRIANILRLTDTAPENILALTFTESAVASMRRRLSELIGSPAYAVTINTFHSFCNDIIKSYPEFFPRIIGSRPITAVDQIAILEQLILSTELELLRPFGDPLLYTRPVLSAIDDLKRQGWEPEAFAQLVPAERDNLLQWPDLRHTNGPHQGKIKGQYQKLFKDIDKNQDLAKLYLAYEAHLTELKLYDYSDMIMEVLRTLQANPDLLQVLQEEYQYILLDEHQDTNNAQNRIVELLASFHDQPNLFVVGDDKQAIFRFQGASLDNFLYFKDRWPEAKLITLIDNYRSTAAILQSAEQVLAGPQPLQSKTDRQSEPIRLAAFSSLAAELNFVVSDIKAKLAAGAPAESIAVLYRDNKDALPLARLAAKQDLPIVIESDQDLLSQPDVKKLIIILAAIEKFGQADSLAAAMHIDLFRLPPLSVYHLIQTAQTTKQSLAELVSQDSTTAEFFRQLSTWRQEAANLDLLTFLERVIRGSGIFEQIIASDQAPSRFEAINRLYQEVANLLATYPEATLTDWFRYLETVKKHRLLIKRQPATPTAGQVRLMTVHRSKGQEFDWVYIIGAYDGHFGGRRGRSILKLLPRVYRLTPTDQTAASWQTEDDDERRLFYVALTRARQGVTITYSRVDETGRDRLPSAFITEIKPDLITDISSGLPALDEVKTAEILLADNAGSKQRSWADREFVREIFLARGLSVSALNNYLICPWRYFYRNLIRLPEAITRSQMYGLAVHQALSDYWRSAAEADFSLDRLLATFVRSLKNQPLTQADYQDCLNRGQTALTGWWQANHQTWSQAVKTEFNIKGVLLTPDIRLTGQLDKLEFLTDTNQVRVVDYKTGRPKSRRAIMGETNSDNEGNYFRQLVFYRLLLDLYDQGRYRMVSGLLDFIEPNDRGQYKQEEFIITDDQVAELTATVKNVANEILELEFQNQRCDDPECYYCSLRALLD